MSFPVIRTSEGEFVIRANVNGTLRAQFAHPWGAMFDFSVSDGECRLLDIEQRDEITTELESAVSEWFKENRRQFKKLLIQTRVEWEKELEKKRRRIRQIERMLDEGREVESQI